MMMAQDGGSLAHDGLQTMRLLQQVVNLALETPAVPNWPRAEIAAEADRFELWAVNMGLFVPGHGSLDYRVREAETLKDTLNRFIRDLNDSLSEVLEYCSSGEEQPSTEEDENSSQSSHDDDIDDSTGYGSDSDIDLLLDSIRDPINRLYRLSTRIRNPSSRFFSSKALRHQEIDQESGVDLVQAFEKFDHDHVSSLFLQYGKLKALEEAEIPPPDQQAEANNDHLWEPIRTVLAQDTADILDGAQSYLVRRIARANVRRRQQFAYWRKHRNKLTRHATEFSEEHIPVRNQEPAPDNLDVRASELPVRPAAPLPSVTTATYLHIPGLERVSDDRSVITVSEYAPSRWRPGAETLEFPSPPTVALDAKFFECPYCFTLCPSELLAEKAWRAHLIHDLRPYVCTYADCRNPDQLYDSRQDWAHHENSSHRMLWRCPEHSDRTFTELEAYREHLESSHSTDGDVKMESAIIRASESTSSAPDRCCPICLMTFEASNPLESHLALHLERFALFALPRSLTDSDSSSDNGNSGKVNIAAEGSRDGDFESDFSSGSAEPVVSERTTLHRAAAKGDLEVVRAHILDPDAYLDLKDDNGRTPLAEAARNGHKGVVELLLQSRRVDLDPVDILGRTPLALAAMNNFYRVVIILVMMENVDVDHADGRGDTPLALAAERGCDEVVRQLLILDANPNSQNVLGQTPLFLAAKGGHTEIVRNLLTTRRIEINARDGHGRTPLAIATELKHQSVMELLAEAGAEMGLESVDDIGPSTGSSSRSYAKGKEREEFDPSRTDDRVMPAPEGSRGGNQAAQQPKDQPLEESTSQRKQLTPYAYTIAWVCALPCERAAAILMLDDEHEAPSDFQPTDSVRYTWGRIGQHCVVIASPPDGRYGVTSATNIALIASTFHPSVCYVLMVGIGSGIPRAGRDVRLGDVVISRLRETSSTVVKYEFPKTAERKRRRIPKFFDVLRHTISNMQGRYSTANSFAPDWGSVREKGFRTVFLLGSDSDILFKETSVHVPGKHCSKCDHNRLVERLPRPSDDPQVHWGMIASGRDLPQHARTFLLQGTEEDVICFDVATAGLPDSLNALVIRGICDYADSHRNDTWHEYASFTSAFFAKKVIADIPRPSVLRDR